MNDVSIIIPVGMYHRQIAQRAIDSASSQTIPCEIISIVDDEQRGPGYIRNRGIEKAKGKWLVFLDADDWIESNFVERCLDVWREGTYIFTDWWQGDVYKTAPEKPWRANGDWHVITALVPKQAMLDIDGFDETLIGGEDSVAWWSLTRAGCCGIPLHEPLFHYGHEGQRAKEFVNNEKAYAGWKALILERFKNQMGCCGDPTTENPDVPSNEPQPGDVLAQAIWAGNRIEYGLATRRQYPRTGNGKQVWVNPADIQAAPHLWREVVIVKEEPKRLHLNGNAPAPSTLPAMTMPPVMHGVQEVARALFPNVQHPADLETLANIEPVGRGDVGQVLRLAKR